MKKFFKFFPLFLILFLFPTLSAIGEETDTDTVDMSIVESINPFDSTAGDFLDFDISAYSKSANEAYQAGDYEKAAKFYLASLQYDITNGMDIYNLACCYGILGNAELAAKCLNQSVKRGFDNIDHINQDPDFDNVRGTEIFDSTVEKIASEIAEKQATMGSVIDCEASAYFECRVKLPENFDPETGHTLIFGLHGYGASPDNFIKLWDRFNTPDFIYASPRAPYPFNVGGEIGYSWNTGSKDDESIEKHSREMTDDYVVSVVNDLKGRYNIDNVYLLGFSQGCGLAYTVGIEHHEMFDGLICFGGWLDTEWLGDEAIDSAKDLRIFIAHGTNDRMVEFSTGEEARDYLIEHGYDVTWCEFDGGHSVPADQLQMAEEW
ncbi:MAG: hypothetical protein ABIC40_05670, partial [bacterium]